jgi:hypothetical protein
MKITINIYFLTWDSFFKVLPQEKKNAPPMNKSFHIVQIAVIKHQSNMVGPPKNGYQVL